MDNPGANMTDASLHHTDPANPPALVWSTKKSGALVDHGRPMTLAEVIAYAKGGAPNASDFEVITPTHLRYRTGLDYRADLIGKYPMPADIDRAMTELAAHLRSLGMSLPQRDLILQAVQAALDAADGDTGADQRALDLLTQVVATPLPTIDAYREEPKAAFPDPNTIQVPDRYQSPDYLAGHLADQFAKVVDQHGPVTAAGVEWHPVTMSTDTATINDRRVLVYVDDQGCTLHLTVDVTIVNAEGS